MPNDRPTPWVRLVHALEDTGMETIPAELVADAVSRMIEAHVADLACREECAVDHAEIYAPAGARCPSCGVDLHSPDARQVEPSKEPERDHAGRTRAEAWRDAAIQAKDDLRAIEEAFAEATPVGEDGPDPPIAPGTRFAQWTSPAVTMRWIERLEEREGAERPTRAERDIVDEAFEDMEASRNPYTGKLPPEPPEEPAPPETEGGEAWEPTVEDFTKASERLWDAEGAPPDIEHDDALWLTLRQFARDVRSRLTRTPTASPGRIDGNGRDLLRTFLRDWPRGLREWTPEDEANRLADELEPHIEAEAPTASERPHEPEECFYHIEPGRGGVAVSFAYHDACRRAAGLRAGQSFYEWVKERAEAPTARPDPIEALAHRAAYHRGWSDALASLESRTTAGVEIEAPTARRVSREALLRAAEAFREAEGRNPLMETAHVVGVQAALESLGIEIEGEEGDHGD